MNEKTKKIAIFLGTLFVAISFISSYIALGSNGGSNISTSVTTTINQRTYFVSGTANGVISSYSNGATVYLNSSANSTTSNDVTNIFSGLESNGSISSYIAQGTNFEVLLSTINAYSLQQVLYTKLNSTKIATVNATSSVTLPARLTLYLSTTAEPILLAQRNYTVNIFPLKPLGTSVKLDINAIVWANGTVEDNQVTLKIVNSS